MYHRTEESISTLISVPGGCGSPRPGTGKGAQTPDPKENRKPSWPPRNWRGDASVQAHGAVRQPGWRFPAAVFNNWVKRTQTWPGSPPLWTQSVFVRAVAVDPAGLSPRPKPRQELFAVLTLMQPLRGVADPIAFKALPEEGSHPVTVRALACLWARIWLCRLKRQAEWGHRNILPTSATAAPSLWTAFALVHKEDKDLNINSSQLRTPGIFSSLTPRLGIGEPMTVAEKKKCSLPLIHSSLSCSQLLGRNIIASVSLTLVFLHQAGQEC